MATGSSSSTYGKLEPYEDEIFDLRRRKGRRKVMSYRKIAKLLLEKYGVKTTHSNVWNFVEVRSRSPRKVVTMLPVFSAPPPPTISPAMSSTLTAETGTAAKSAVMAAIAALKNKTVARPAESPFHDDSDSKPLTPIK